MKTSIISLQAELADLGRTIIDLKPDIETLVVWKQQLESAPEIPLFTRPSKSIKLKSNTGVPGGGLSLAEMMTHRKETSSFSSSLNNAPSSSSSFSEKVVQLELQLDELNDRVKTFQDSLTRSPLGQQAGIESIRQSQRKLETSIETLLTWRAETLALHIAHPPANIYDLGRLAAEVAVNTSQISAVREVQAKMALDTEQRVYGAVKELEKLMIEGRKYDPKRKVRCSTGGSCTANGRSCTADCSIDAGNFVIKSPETEASWATTNVEKEFSKAGKKVKGGK